MSNNSAIEWTDATWNPVTGCEEVSPGCEHCYAKTFSERFRGTPGHHFENGFDLTLRPDKLDLPLRWKKPRRIFVNSMSDLFHKDVPDEYIASVFAVMALAPQHTFQVLTKRHGRMRSLLSDPGFSVLLWAALVEHRDDFDLPWPLPNVWLGVSVEDQQRADLRIPALLDTPAAVRWISAEPLLGPVDLREPLALDTAMSVLGIHSSALVPYASPGLDWVVVGGESGRGARPMHPDWARSLRDQCQQAGVPFLFKQWGAWQPAPWTGERGATHAFTGGLDADGTQHFMLLGHTATSSERSGQAPPGAQGMRNVGKKAAGRELDGRTWDEYPAVQSVRSDEEAL